MILGSRGRFAHPISGWRYLHTAHLSWLLRIPLLTPLLPDGMVLKLPPCILMSWIQPPRRCIFEMAPIPTFMGLVAGVTPLPLSPPSY